MAASVTVKIEGLSELGRALKALGDDVVLKTSRIATRAAANIIRDNAKRNAPVRTGALKDAIGVRRDTKLSTPGYEVMGVGVFKLTGKAKGAHKDEVSPAFYWRFVEFGTVKMSAKAFLRPAYDQSKTEAVDALVDVLGKGIERASKR